MSPSRQSRILIVDDEPSVLCALTRCLRVPNAVACGASSGDEALAIMEADPCEVVLSDEGMPGMTGTSLLAIVKRRWPDTVRILMTGNMEFGVAQTAINACAVHRLLSKPIHGQELAQVLKGALDFRELGLASRRLLSLFGRSSQVFEELDAFRPELSSRLQAIARAALYEQPSSAEDLDVFLELLRHELAPTFGLDGADAASVPRPLIAGPISPPAAGVQPEVLPRA